MADRQDDGERGRVERGVLPSADQCGAAEFVPANPERRQFSEGQPCLHQARECDGARIAGRIRRARHLQSCRNLAQAAWLET
jgi:hypothetical protein